MSDAADTAGTTPLRDRFAGSVVERGQDGYDAARTVFNAMIDKRPEVIARCANATDVVAALGYGRANGLEIAVRSGGHGVAGTSLTDSGIVIDLGSMNSVQVDADARIARVAGGATWGDVDRACQPHGLATTGGRVSTTGVAGFTLGGGDGWLSRSFGFACDNLASVELVTADGRTVTASDDDHPELFWALHGGGGNFGIATALTLRLHPLPVVTLGLLTFAPQNGPTVISRYRDLIESDAPDALGGGLDYVTGPPEDFIPDRLVGNLTLLAIVVYAGPQDEARRVIHPLLDLHPEGQMITELPYADIQCAFDAEPGYRNYWSAEHLASLPNQALERLCARADDMLVPSASEFMVLPWGGAVARSAETWPIANRGATWCVHPFGAWQDPADDERAIAWVKGLRAELAPFTAGGAYLNFTPDEGKQRTIAGYGGETNYRRLTEIKSEYDPDNTFRLNHNIEPAPR
ncbi:MAG: FAD-binding oxidoreductase [Actinomycetota bacterium]|nr:FAD-binding oxidoreductase [Actinomycetota bacterium]